MQKGIKVSSLQRKGDKVVYRGMEFRLNEPIPSTAKGKKLMVLSTKKIRGEVYVRLIHFGALGYGHNYSWKAKRSYLARSSEIRNKAGKLTRNDRWSANYWARKILWPANKPVNGPKKTRR